MNNINVALNNLYKAQEEPLERSGCMETAIEYLEYELDELDANISHIEIVDIINSLADESELDNVIFELEVLIGEV